jgi:hypothetical protein
MISMRLCTVKPIRDSVKLTMGWWLNSGVRQ